MGAPAGAGAAWRGPCRPGWPRRANRNQQACGTCWPRRCTSTRSWRSSKRVSRDDGSLDRPRHTETHRLREKEEDDHLRRGERLPAGGDRQLGPHRGGHRHPREEPDQAGGRGPQPGGRRGEARPRQTEADLRRQGKRGGRPHPPVPARDRQGEPAHRGAGGVPLQEDGGGGEHHQEGHQDLRPVRPRALPPGPGHRLPGRSAGAEPLQEGGVGVPGRAAPGDGLLPRAVAPALRLDQAVHRGQAAPGAGNRQHPGRAEPGPAQGGAAQAPGRHRPAPGGDHHDLGEVPPGRQPGPQESRRRSRRSRSAWRSTTRSSCAAWGAAWPCAPSGPASSRSWACRPTG